jgi:ABC-type multidrug transport system fused ATPase/permease subunit
LIKLFTQEEDELSREKFKAKEVMGMNLDLALTSGVASALSGLFIGGCLIFILWYGSYQVIIGALSIGSLVAIYTYIARLFGPVGALTGLNVALQTTMVSAERVFEFLDVKPHVEDKTGARPIDKVEGEIDFQNVCFGYDDCEAPILEKINFSIKPGESIGLVGPSGTGKTTLVQLITRFYDPTSGRVLLDGIDLQDIKLRSLRRHIGMVTQDIVLFNASIRENIVYGKPNASGIEIVQAAKIAGIHEYIISLDKGYKTELGERGLRLSQGQRQRIALARVVLKNPKIFLLDEATASLDSESEMQIQKAITQVMKGRTSIVIAHRLATIQSVDRIFVLEGKELVEEGTFEDLMDKKGRFHEIYMAQFGGFHAFEDKLAYEMKRARDYEETLLLLGVLIENYSDVETKVGREKGEEMFGNISKSISENLRDIDFVSADPHQKNLFYIVMPKIKPLQEEAVQKKIREIVPQEIHLRFSVAISDIHGHSVEELIRHGKEMLSRP